MPNWFWFANLALAGASVFLFLLAMDLITQEEVAYLVAHFTKLVAE